jgi:hypothetical protein
VPIEHQVELIVREGHQCIVGQAHRHDAHGERRQALGRQPQVRRVVLGGGQPRRRVVA